jgi:hypothetical protein
MDALSILLPIQGLSELAQEDTSYMSPKDSSMMVFPADHPSQTEKVVPRQDAGAVAAAIAGIGLLGTTLIVVSVGSIVLSAYHGYKRNGNDLAWGALWGVMGATFGPIPVGIAWAQGFAKRAR